MGIIDDLKNLVGGSDEEAAAAREQGFSGIASSAPRNLAKAASATVAFSPVNDVSDTLGAATGTDPLTGYRQSKQERGLGFASLFGFGAAASAMGVIVNGGRMARRLEQAMDASHLRTTGTYSTTWVLQANQMRENDMLGIKRSFAPPTPQPDALENIAGFARRGTQMMPVQRTTSELAAANQPVALNGSHAANGWVNFRDTHGWMETSPDPATGFARHARILSDVEDPVALERSLAFLQTMAPRWARGTHYSKTNIGQLQGDQLDQAHITIVGFELSRFNAAMEKGILNNTTKHKQGRLATAAWEKMRRGESLAPKETELLGDVMEKFADAVWMFDSPELTGTPLAMLKKVDIEGDLPTYSMRYKQFDAISEDMMTWKEANRRMAALYSGDAMAMVPLNTSMITRFTQKHVTEPIMEYFRQWYPEARRTTGLAADEVGWDHTRFIVTTAIMSPGQSWDANIPKAKAFARAYADYEAGKFNTPLTGEISKEISDVMLRELKDAGIKLKKGQVDDGSPMTRLWAAMARGDYSEGKGQMIPLSSAIQAVLVAKAKDPMSIFTTGSTRATATKGGLPAGLRVGEMRRIFEAGEADADTLFAQRYNDPDQQLKVPSFTYSILNSTDEDLLDQSRYMTMLMKGGGIFRENLTDAEVMKSLRGELPVVVDRQAFKVGNGMSLLPDTFLSSQKGVFDALAQAYRNASLELGVVKALGRHLLPEELQAITWIQYRELANVKFEIGEVPKDFIPGRTMNTELNPMRGERRWKPGFRRPTPNTVLAGYKEGAGADYIWDREVYDQMTGNAEKLPWHGVEAVDDGTNYGYGQVMTDPDDWADEPSATGRDRSVSAVRDIDMHQAPDGTMKVLVPKGSKAGPSIYGALDARSPALGYVEIDGVKQQVMTRGRPVAVADVTVLMDDLHAATQHRANPELADNTGAAVFYTNPPDTLSLVNGNHMWVSTVESMEPGDNFGESRIRQAHAELAAAGIKAEIKITDSYLGVTKPPPAFDADTPYVPGVEEPTAWAPQEARRGAILSFETNDQMQAADRWMLEEGPGPDGDMIPNFKRLFEEDVLDSRYYIDGPSSAPPGTTMVFEHHFRDTQGRELVNLNTAGDKYWSNTRTVYLPDEMAKYVTGAETQALKPGAPMHTIGPWATVPPVDGLEVRSIQAPAGVETSLTNDELREELRAARRAVKAFGEPPAKGRTKASKAARAAFDADVAAPRSRENAVKTALSDIDAAAWSGIETRTPFDRYEVRTAKADGTYGETWEKPKVFAVHIPEDGTPPVIVIGADTIPGVDPQRIVTVQMDAEPEFVGKGGKKGQIKTDKKTKKQVWHDVVRLGIYRNEEGLADAVYNRDVRELLRRVGFTGSFRTKQWDRKP